MKKILLGTNLKPAMENVLEDAYLLAYEFDAEVVPLHVIEHLPYYSKKQETSFLHSALLKRITKVQDDLVLKNILVADPVIREGKPCTELLNSVEELDCDLLMIGSGHSQGVHGLGESANKILRQAKVPVWLSHPDVSVENYNHIICAVDFSYHSKKTLKTAVLMARAFNAELTILHVAQEMALYPGLTEEGVFVSNWGSHVYSVPFYEGEGLEREKQRLKEMDRGEMDEFIADINLEGVSYHHEIRYGLTYKEVLASVKEHQAGLLVIGSHGRGGFFERLLGGTIEKILGNLTSTLLVVT